MSTSPKKPAVVQWTRSSVLWIAVLTIMAGFQLWRGAWVDGVLFALLVGMLVADTMTGGRIRLLRRPVTVPKRYILAWTAGLGVVLVLAPRHGWIDLGVTVIIGVAALMLAWVPDPRSSARPRLAVRRSAFVWSVLAVLLCMWEALAFILGQPSATAKEAFPTVSILLDPFVEWPIGRLIFVVLWLLGGLGLLRIWSRQ